MSTVVLIDDSALVLSLMERYLTGAGCYVSSFLSAKEAMKFVARTPVDLIVTDIYMPDEDGLEVIRRTRAAYPMIPVIVVTGAEGTRDMSQIARRLGAVCTLHKPFSRNELLQAVTIALKPALENQIRSKEPGRG